MSQLLIYFGVALGISAALVPLCRLTAFRLGYVAKPRADRWHQRPTPLLGGVAIVLATLGSAVVLLPFEEIRLLAVCGVAVFMVGLTDDIISLKPSTKLVAQIALASVFAYFGYRLGWTDSPALDSILTIVWIVGITNALNLLDNMDGLCAGIGLIAGVAILAAIVPAVGITSAGLFLALMLGATAGFLLYNFHPASVFMGDSGSLFVGLMLAVLALHLPDGALDRSNLLAVMAAPVLVLLIPIFDTVLVTTSRLFVGRRPSQGGRDHSSHRLVAIGLPERTAVLVLWALAALGGTIAWTTSRVSAVSSLPTAALFVLAMAVFAAYLWRVRVYQDVRVATERRSSVTVFIADFMYKRRVAEVMLDFCLVALAYYASYHIRFEGDEFPIYFQNFVESLPIVLGVQMVVLFAVGAYRGVWRHFSLMDAVVFGKGVLLGTLLIQFAILYIYRFENYSRTVYVIYATLLFLALVASRASFRLISEFARRRRQGLRLVVYGAGGRGALAVREVLGDESSTNFTMLGFIDDDADKQRDRVLGYPVLGGYESLVSLIRGGAVDAVIIAARLVDVHRQAELESLCAANRVRLSRIHFDLEDLVAVS
jgi:UDP-GlcNAc:undecaprenyl-phosphate/decaprenyl-phosphate GlcNAc-1-phosphate transferase